MRFGFRRQHLSPLSLLSVTLSLIAFTLSGPAELAAQGVTTGGLRGFVVSEETGEFLVGAVVTATHVPSGTRYSTVSRAGGAYTIPNMRVGGPYTVEVNIIGFAEGVEQNVTISLGQDLGLNFRLSPQAVPVEELRVTLQEDKVLNPDRTGAATFVDPEQVIRLPSINRSTRDLIRLDPRNDGNYAFGGRNWLYNNISLDGSYFNNTFGLDDPAPGGQTASEPIPYDAVEQVEVSIAPFDVREGGFTGANVNTVTKSGTNEWSASAYGFFRNESLLGNSVRGQDVIANPDLTFNQWGATLGGPISRDKAFFFLAGEIVRRDDPGTNFVAGGSPAFGQSRVDPAVMDQIRDRMMTVYGYDTGPYEGFVHETNSDKLIAKIDWNVNENNNLTFRYSYLNASRDLPPHPFVLSFANTGRGPNSTSLPFQNSGYAINNELNSFAFELNSRATSFANRFFASYNRFRDFRDPFSADFPTIEIGEGGVTYTTVGHEPFSIHNILDTDVLQLTNNFSWFKGKHVLTFGANFELYSFFNSFNIFRHGVFFLPEETGIGSTFDSLDEFFAKTDPSSPDFVDFNALVGSGPFKGETFDIGQFSLYAQDEVPLSDRFNLTLGVRVDFPMYLTDPVDNPFSRGLTALDENRMPETVDQSDLPGATPLFSPRVGFNWDASPDGDRSTQIRGGTGIFTGRVPFVWVGNVYSNPGANPNLYAPFFNEDVEQIRTSDDAILQQSFDLNAMDPDFKWPQLWVSSIAIDQRLPGDFLGTVEFSYGKDINNVFMRNADLVAPVRTLAQDGRPYYGGFGNNELNPDGGAGIYVIDNTSEGYNLSLTAQLRKRFDIGVNAILSYAFTQAKNKLKSTEIASVLWQNQPIKGDPNNPELSHSEFGQRHRIVGAATWDVEWSEALATQFGVFLEVAEGNRFTGAGGNRYSFIYSGDVNGDGQGGNDLIYIPADASEITFDPCTAGCGGAVSPQAQWDAFNAFVEQDRYLSKHRGEIAERFGLLNPWYQTVDIRILQDIGFDAAGKRHRLQLNFDVMNFLNLLSSDWGVRKFASPAATSPLRLVRFDGAGEPVFNFTGPAETFIDDPFEFSRWRIQIGAKYILN